jgi:hypothetical protein
MRKRGQRYLRSKCNHPDCHEIISVLFDNWDSYNREQQQWDRDGVYCYKHSVARRQEACNVDGGGI